MSKNTMSWIVVILLVLIIALLSICIYLDIEFTAAFTSSTVPNTTQDGTTSTPPVTTLPVTTPKAPITSKAPITAAKPPVTQAPITSTVLVTTTKAPITTKAPETTKPQALPEAPTICIDPGHGFTDPGACRVMNGVLYEEDLINLAIAMKLKDELIALGFNVIMTHDGENLPANRYLNDSSTPFNANGRNLFIRDHKDEIDLVVSIHCNTNDNTTITGTRFYILSSKMTGYTAKSVTLAEKLLEATKMLCDIRSPEKMPDFCDFREILRKAFEAHNEYLSFINSGAVPRSNARRAFAVARLRAELSRCFDEAVEVMLGCI